MQSLTAIFSGDMRREDAPLVFAYVFVSTTALIMTIYFFSLFIFHCVFWPKKLAKIKADKPVQVAKQEQKLRELSVGRDKPTEDKTQSERTETPVVEHTPPSENEQFRGAHTVVSENASLIGDKTPGSARSARSAMTCAATVTAAPAASPRRKASPQGFGLETAKECRAKPRRWFEDDMMTTGMELSQPAAPRKSQESKDHRKGKGKRSEDIRTGKDDKEYHLRTGRETKVGGKTIKRLRFAAPRHRDEDDTRTCVEKQPLLSQSIEDHKSDEQKQLQEKQKRNSEEARKKRKIKDQPPASWYAYEVDPTQKELRGTERKRSREIVAGTATRTAQSSDNSRERQPHHHHNDKLLELCKTQED